MQRIINITSIALLCSSLFGQGAYSSPDGFLNTEGKSAAYIFGEYPEPRIMMFDGEMRNKVIVMNEIAFRHDYRDYPTYRGAARSWAKITLDVSYCDYTKADTVFANNPTSTPSRVYDNAMNWPGIVGFPATNPAKFDTIKFPFSSIWIYNGAEDICLDWDFQGGTLANNKTWSSNRYETYYLDAPIMGNEASGEYFKYGTGCTDSGSPNNPATTWVYTKVYNNKYVAEPTWRNQYRVYTQTRYTAKGAPVIVALTLGGSSAGINFPGLACEKVYINLAGPMLLVPLIAGTSSTARVYMPLPGILFPYNATLAGLDFWAQSVWDDSVTNQLRISQGEKSLLPLMPPSYKRQTIFQTDPLQKATNADGFDKAFESTHNPVIRYGQ